MLFPDPVLGTHCHPDCIRPAFVGALLPVGTFLLIPYRSSQAQLEHHLLQTCLCYTQDMPHSTSGTAVALKPLLEEGGRKLTWAPSDCPFHGHCETWIIGHAQAPWQHCNTSVPAAPPAELDSQLACRKFCMSVGKPKMGSLPPGTTTTPHPTLPLSKMAFPMTQGCDV